jgi:predicted RecA/RadA family phage recombinase
MEALFIHEGRVIDYTPTEDMSAGTVVVLGDRVGVSMVDIAANVLGAVQVVGVFDFAKDNTVIPLYGKVYWDATAKKATLTASGNTLLGIALHATAATDNIVRVRLNS